MPLYNMIMAKMELSPHMDSYWAIKTIAIDYEFYKPLASHIRSICQHRRKDLLLLPLLVYPWDEERYETNFKKKLLQKLFGTFPWEKYNSIFDPRPIDKGWVQAPVSPLLHRFVDKLTNNAKRELLGKLLQQERIARENAGLCQGEKPFVSDADETRFYQTFNDYRRGQLPVMNNPTFAFLEDEYARTFSCKRKREDDSDTQLDVKRTRCEQ
jgi:hypothetical protein